MRKALGRLKAGARVVGENLLEANLLGVNPLEVEGEAGSQVEILQGGAHLALAMDGTIALIEVEGTDEVKPQ